VKPSVPLTCALLLLGSASAGLAEPEPPFAPPRRLTIDGRAIDVAQGHAAPFVGDLDGDGRPELLVGQFGEGLLRVYPLGTTPSGPRLEGLEWFRADGKDGRVPTG
jgi:hypothetical protein